MITETLYNMMLAAVAVVFIVDLSGFSDTVCDVWARLIHAKGVESVKPFTCSLCMTFWVTNIVALCDGWLCWESVVASCILALMADTIGQALMTAKDIAKAILHIINYLTDKVWQLLS